MEQAGETVDERKQKQDDAALLEMALKLGRGQFKLAVPLMSNGKQFAEIEYDFNQLTGWEYAEAMDADTDFKPRNAFSMTDRQALALFGMAVEKKMDRAVDNYDVKRGLSIQDAIKAVQITNVFFAACSRAGNNRITNL